MGGGQASFADAFLAPGIGRNERLERIADLIDWSPIEALAQVVRPGVEGRPPYAPLSMIKALLLQQWYGLSDPGLEEALYDRISFRRFCGLGLADATPDETTLCRFRNDLKTAGLGDALFAAVMAQLEAKGLVVKQGTLIDATLIAAAVRPPPSDPARRGEEESRSPHDGDANWTRSGQKRQLFFGYKAHVGVDQGSGLIRARAMTPAKTAETLVADQMIAGDEKAVYADKAYDKKARRAALKAQGVKDRIQHRRNKHQPALPRWQTVRNILIGRVRGAVERVFAAFKTKYRLRRAPYRGLNANAFNLDLAVIAYNLRRAERLTA